MERYIRCFWLEITLMERCIRYFWLEITLMERCIRCFWLEITLMERCIVQHTSVRRNSCALKKFCIKERFLWREIIHSFDWISSASQLQASSHFPVSSPLLQSSFHFYSQQKFKWLKVSFAHLSVVRLFTVFFFVAFITNQVLPLKWEDTEKSREMFANLLTFFKSAWTEECLDEETAKSCGLTRAKKAMAARCEKMDKSWIKDATDRFFLCEYKGGAIRAWGDTTALLAKVKDRTSKSLTVPIPKWPFAKFACNSRKCKNRCKKCLLCHINKMNDAGRTQTAKLKKCTSPNYPCMTSFCTAPLAYPEKQKKAQSPVDFGSSNLKTLMQSIFFVPPLLDFALPQSTLDCDKEEYLHFLHGFFASLFISATKWGIFKAAVRKMISGGMKKFCLWIVDSIQKCEQQYGFNHTRWSEAHALYQRHIVEILNVFPQTNVLKSGSYTCGVSFNATAALMHPEIGWNKSLITIPLAGSSHVTNPEEVFSCRNSLVQPYSKPVTLDDSSDDDDDTTDAEDDDFQSGSGGRWCLSPVRWREQSPP